MLGEDFFGGVWQIFVEIILSTLDQYDCLLRSGDVKDYLMLI